ncbi:hypothetical protein K227x_53240 [Rubripirellula lacrimiformis]|uniref:Uncharacterized protein n=1 Tax=Rubripirellula lacrimiformis TaxID=1930273 RepID=A0A517NIE3_9BACT|nr:hypothetical protein [Rubripirellula lacrimiformis]QDT06901.1 hypothetical protein K227x_53240 [Rubripirellula lacrimiformis]
MKQTTQTVCEAGNEPPRRRSARAKALIQSHGWPQDQACEAMGLDPAKYLPNVAAFTMPDHMPTRAEIEAITSAMRSGELVISQQSARRWEKYRAEQERMAQPEAEQRDAYELAGRIAEDDCPVPSWLYSAGPIGDEAD